MKVLPQTELAVFKPMAVGIKIELPSPSGGFAVQADASGVQVDVVGDGNANVKAKEGQPVIMNLRYEDGTSCKYALRFFRGERMQWYYETATSMQGTIKGVNVTLIDANCNGKWDEFGKDAIIVGKGRFGIPLSRVIPIKDGLFHVKVDPRGASISIQEYTGSTGTLDLIKNFKAPGGLEYAVVQNGEAFFDLMVKGGLKVPAGKYVFAGGRLVKAKKSCDIVRGEWKEAVVADGAKCEPEWGPPMRLAFQVKLTDDKFHIDASIRVFGLGGEEYVNFQSTIMTPDISVKSKDGAEAAKGKFATG
jgi:hypothetical protein